MDVVFGKLMLMELLNFFEMSPGAWISWILAMGLSVWLYVMVRRGRMIPFEHPYCSECGFNLYGLPGTSTNCPECGGELKQVRKTEIRKRRWRGLLVTFALVVACTVPMGAYVYREVREKSQRLDDAPTFALMWFRSNPAVQQALYRRMMEGGLSKSQEETMAETLIAQPRFSIYQVMELRNKGHFPDAQWKKALEKGAVPYVDWRSTVSRGDPMVLRVFQFMIPEAHLQMRHRLHVKIDDEEIASDVDWVDGLKVEFYQLAPRFIEIPAKVAGKLADGLHNVSVSIEGEIVDQGVTPPLRVSKTSVVTSVIDLLPAGKSSVTLVKPSKKTSVPAGDLTIYLNGDFPEVGSGDWFVDCRTLSYSYRLIARQDGREFPIGLFQLGMRERYWLPVSGTPLHAGKCDVIVRTDLESARRTVTMEKVVDDEFVVHDAIVKRDSKAQ